MGKGSKQRPFDKGKFNVGFDKVFRRGKTGSRTDSKSTGAASQSGGENLPHGNRDLGASEKGTRT